MLENIEFSLPVTNFDTSNICFVTKEASRSDKLLVLNNENNNNNIFDTVDLISDIKNDSNSPNFNEALLTHDLYRDSSILSFKSSKVEVSALCNVDKARGRIITFKLPVEIFKNNKPDSQLTLVEPNTSPTSMNIDNYR